MSANQPRVSGVLLAAGRSTRMGVLKQVSLLAGEPLSRHAAKAVAGGHFASLLAVIPPDAAGEDVRNALSGLGFNFVINPDPSRGLASSFRVAMQALTSPPLTPPLDAAQFSLADMPFVTAQTHHAVQAEFARSGAPVVLTQYEGTQYEPGQYGHTPAVQAPPHLFSAALFAELATLPDQDHGPRKLVRRYAKELRIIQRPAAELFDVDTPEQLLAAQNVWDIATRRR